MTEVNKIRKKMHKERTQIREYERLIKECEKKLAKLELDLQDARCREYQKQSN